MAKKSTPTTTATTEREKLELARRELNGLLSDIRRERSSCQAVLNDIRAEQEKVREMKADLIKFMIDAAEKFGIETGQILRAVVDKRIEQAERKADEIGDDLIQKVLDEITAFRHHMVGEGEGKFATPLDALKAFATWIGVQIQVAPGLTREVAQEITIGLLVNK